MPLDWDKLRVFHAAAEAGSFTHAAEKLRLSQSAISRQVSALEHDVGVPLFHRHARGLVMTEQGEMLYRTAHDVLMKLENVKVAPHRGEGPSVRPAAGSQPRSASAQAG
jgi:DNA-binding transcriptional LysR family regulator